MDADNIVGSCCAAELNLVSILIDNDQVFGVYFDGWQQRNSSREIAFFWGVLAKNGEVWGFSVKTKIGEFFNREK